MSLVGPRPKSVYDLAPLARVALPRAGICRGCLTPLRSDTDAQLHLCVPIPSGFETSQSKAELDALRQAHFLSQLREKAS